MCSNHPILGNWREIAMPVIVLTSLTIMMVLSDALRGR